MYNSALLLRILTGLLSCNTIKLSGLEDRCKDRSLPLHKIVHTTFGVSVCVCVYVQGFSLLLHPSSPIAVITHLRSLFLF